MKKRGINAVAWMANLSTAGRLDIEMSEKQQDMARHALGLPNREYRSYRNHFCIGPGGDGYEDWLDLASKGLAIRRTVSHWGGDDMFYLTLKGALMARLPNESISAEDALDMRRREQSEPPLAKRLPE